MASQTDWLLVPISRLSSHLASRIHLDSGPATKSTIQRDKRRRILQKVYQAKSDHARFSHSGLFIAYRKGVAVQPLIEGVIFHSRKINLFHRKSNPLVVAWLDCSMIYHELAISLLPSFGG